MSSFNSQQQFAQRKKILKALRGSIILGEIAKQHKLTLKLAANILAVLLRLEIISIPVAARVFEQMATTRLLIEIRA